VRHPARGHRPFRPAVLALLALLPRLLPAQVGARPQARTAGASVTPSGPAVLVGAGDIANCHRSLDAAMATARLLDSIPGTVFTAGDDAQGVGAPSEYARCYAPTWGRVKSRTRPAPGNHDYMTNQAAAYYDYFGGAAGPAGHGYYSYDLGSWHIISLNSMHDFGVGIGATSTQGRWLRANLAANTRRCILAYWHYPRFSSGNVNGSDSLMRAFWDPLYQAGATIVINGHDHIYERFAPQTPDGAADPVHGIREFIVGTGGDHLYGFRTPLKNSEVRNATSHGVLKLTLLDGSYTWEFIPIAGDAFTDSGSATCNPRPRGTPGPRRHD
jgi:hypothetical protein